MNSKDELSILQKLLNKQREQHLDRLAGNNKAKRDAKAPARDPGQTLLQKLNKAAQHRQLEKHSDESIQWFKRNASKAAGKERAQTALLDQQKKARGIGKTIPIGKMYTYAYDAKHKDTLPYFDRFPLIFYVGPAPKGFYGINLHYLSPDYRAILFDALLDLATNKKYSSSNKLTLTYKLLVSTQSLSFFKPCFKQYLHTQLQSDVVEIPYHEWETALFLPTADFQGATNTQVWSDSALGL
jgi:hypothetical protein